MAATGNIGHDTLNIGGLLGRHARYRADHPALVVGGRSLTYRELEAYVNRLANALLQAGLRKGDKFATVLPNCLELMASYWAAAKTGLVIVPASPLLQPSGLNTLLRDSDARLVIGDAAFAKALAPVRRDLPLLERVVLVGAPATVDTIAFDAFGADASDRDPPDPQLSGEDVFNIM